MFVLLRQKDLCRFMEVCCTQGSETEQQGGRNGWLVSKSKQSGHLSAGTDDTATARQEAIIPSLVAQHWASHLCDRNWDIQHLTHCSRRYNDTNKSTRYWQWLVIVYIWRVYKNHNLRKRKVYVNPPMYWNCMEIKSVTFYSRFEHLLECREKNEYSNICFRCPTDQH